MATSHDGELLTNKAPVLTASEDFLIASHSGKPMPRSDATLILNTVTALVITPALTALHLHYELHPECNTCHADKTVCWAHPPWHRHLPGQIYDDPMPTGHPPRLKTENPPEK